MPTAEDGGMEGEVGREPQYEVFADEFLEHAEDGFFNAHTTGLRAWHCWEMWPASGCLTRPAARAFMRRN